MNKKIEEALTLLNQFDKKFTIFKSERNDFTAFYNIMILCITELILCKSIFKRNKDAMEFLSKVFGLNFPEYVSKNRTLLLGRTIKYFSEIQDSDQILQILNKMFEVITSILDDNYDQGKLSWQEVIDSLNLNGR